MFTRPPASGQDTSFDVKAAMTQKRRMKDALDQYQEKLDRGEEVHPGMRARAEALKVLHDSLEDTLQTVLLANNLFYDKDQGLISDPSILFDVISAREEQAEKIRNYQKIALSHNDRILNNLEAYTQDKLQLEYNKVLEDDKTFMFFDRDEQEDARALQDVPFTFQAVSLGRRDEFIRIRRNIDTNPDRYEAHKDVIDRIVAEYLSVQKTYQDRTRTGRAYVWLGGEEYVTTGNAQLNKMYNDLANRILGTKEMAVMHDRTTALADMLDYLLLGVRANESPGVMDIALEREFGVLTEERKNQLESVATAEAMEAKQRELEEGQAAAAQRRQEYIERMKVEAPYTDPQALDIAAAIRHRERMFHNADADYQKLGIKEAEGVKKVDGRTLRLFERGYNVDQDGEPVTDVDRKNKDADMAFVADYMSGDLERIRPHLDRLTQEMLTYDIREDMLTDEYQNDHAVEQHDIVNKMYYFENVVNLNPEYYMNLPQSTAALIRHRFLLFSAYAYVQMNVVGRRGVVVNNGALIKPDDPVSVPIANAIVDRFGAELPEKLAEYRKAEARIKAFEKVEKEESAPRALTIEESVRLTALYPEALKAKAAFRDEFVGRMVAGNQLGADKVAILQSSPRLYDRMAWSLDPGLTDEVNLRRLEAVIEFAEGALSAGRVEEYRPSAGTIDTIRGYCADVMGGLRYYGRWIDLSEHEIYENAAEILNAHMRMEHISDIAKKTFDPGSAGKSLWEDLMTPEMSAIAYALDAYKSAIRSAVFKQPALTNLALRKNASRYLTGEDAGKPVREVLENEQDRYMEMRAALAEMPGYQSLKRGAGPQS
jgi:hypothetical protein